MAIIGKIREKSWLLLLLVGGALLAFIFMDYNKMTGGTAVQEGIGTIEGERVDMGEFNKNVEMAQLNADRRAQQEGKPKAEPVDQDAVWNVFTKNILLEKEYEKLGIDVSANEFDAFLFGKQGFDVLPEFQQTFRDSITGQFSENMLRARIEQMQNAEDPEVKAQWEETEKYYKQKRKEDKYFNILKQGLYVTNLEAKNEYIAQKEVKSIDFVVQRYNTIPDEEIKVTDEEVKAFYEKNKDDVKYQVRVPSRDVRYFDVSIVPSAKDSMEFNKMIADLKARFEKAENDSLFVIDRKNSDFNFYSSTSMATYKPDTDQKAMKRGLVYPAHMDTVFKNAHLGQIIGPYQDGPKTRIAKVKGFNEDLLTVRHILIAAPRNDTVAVKAAKKKVDSLLPLINKDNFVEYVLKYSEDPGSKNTGGKYEDFMDYEMVPEFSKFAKENPVGKIGYVQTDYGFHIIEVLEKEKVKYPILTVVEKELKPSFETIEKLDGEINDLLYEIDEKLSKIDDPYKKVEMFDSIAREKGYYPRTLNIPENNPKIYGFTNPLSEAKLLRLAYEDGAGVGELIDSPIKEKNRYIIAILSSIKEEGTPSFENVKLRMRNDLIQKKKAERLIAKMVGAKSLLDEIVKKNPGARIQSAEVVFAKAQIQGAGYEPKIIGAIFSGLKDGQMTVPLEGNSGVYVVLIKKTQKAPAVSDYSAEKEKLEQQLKGGIDAKISNALRKVYDVKDDRKFFEFGIKR